MGGGKVGNHAGAPSLYLCARDELLQCSHVRPQKSRPQSQNVPFARCEKKLSLGYYRPSPMRSERQPGKTLQAAYTGTLSSASVSSGEGDRRTSVLICCPFEEDIGRHGPLPDTLQHAPTLILSCTACAPLFADSAPAVPRQFVRALWHHAGQAALPPRRLLRILSDDVTMDRMAHSPYTLRSSLPSWRWHRAFERSLGLEASITPFSSSPLPFRLWQSLSLLASQPSSGRSEGSLPRRMKVNARVGLHRTQAELAYINHFTHQFD